MIPFITKFLPYILGGLGVLIAAVAAGVLLIVRSSQKRNPAAMLSAAMKQKAVLEKQYEKYEKQAGSAREKAGAAAESMRPPMPPIPPKPSLWSRFLAFFGIHSGNLSQSFKQSMKLLRARIPGRDYRYRVPWFIMMGESGSGKTTLLDNVTLPKPFGTIGDDPFMLRNPVTWWLFSNGVVLDVDGSMIASPDGHTSDDATWHSFLSLVRHNRPERPVDGFIITIPAGDLIGPTKLSNEDLRRKADLLYQKIWSAQKALGMTFPAYVFVTKCDHIPGFRSYVSELPKHLQDDIFGWSSPYSVHAAYVSEWLDQAFANLNNAIYKTQLEIFAESEVVEDSDGVFIFPTEFQSLAEPLRIYVNHIFKESAYHESFMFRGVYFTGDADLDAPVSTELGGAFVPIPPGTRAKPVFLKHVFEKKIFLEHPLARPVFRSVLARNRWALGGQIACLAFVLIGGLALWLSGRSLVREATAFRPVLLDVEKDLTQIRDVEQSSSQQLTVAEQLQRMQGVDPTKVLDGMQAISAGTLKSFWLPASWMSDLDDRLDMALNVTFSKIVLGSIYLNLTERVQQTLEIESEPPPADATYKVVNVAAMPEFQALRNFVNRIKDVEPNIEMYNFEAMPDSGDLPTLGKLVKYVYDKELPQSFYDNSDFYFRALKASQQDVINTDEVKQSIAMRQQELGQKFFDALLERALPIAQLDELQTELDTLAREPTRANSDPEPYRALMATIDQLNQILSRPEFAWLGKMTFDPGPDYQQLLDTMQMSMLFGPGAKMKLQDMATVNFDVIHSTLQNYSSSLTGQLLQTSDYKLSPAVLALRKGLEDFLNQKFMAAATARRIRTTAPPGSRFTWDVGGLQQALQLVEPYNAFAVGGLTSFPMELQNRLRLMALNRLEANMVAIISGAERTDAAILPNGSLEDDVQTEARQLKDVTKPLSDLLTAFDRLGMTQAYSDLSEATLSSAFLHLRAVEQLFNQKAPYAFNEAGLARWDGTEPLVVTALGVHDDKELPQYVDAQHESLKRLKEYADPALSIINNQRATRRNAADAQLLTKWRGIATEMDKFDNKNPSSNVAALDAFIGTVLPTLTIDNYTEKITRQDLTAQSTDFFLARRNDLRRLVYERFDALATARVVSQYRELETAFNQKLAGRFPFMMGVGNGAEADPQSLRDVFKTFDGYNKNIIKYLERTPARNGAAMRVLQFIDQMGAVRMLFAPFLDDAKAVAPVFDYEVEFRVNRRREAGGNQIIEWQLEVNDQKINARDAMRRGRWVFGDPVRLSLRWAKDANIIPAPEVAEGVVYEDKKVTFWETNRWAIFRLLRTHASVPTDFDQLVDPTPQTLKFIVPTMMTGDDPMQTRVFVRLTLLTADKKEPITLPVFPDRAPSLDAR